MEEKNNEMRSFLDQAYINPNFNISMLGMKLNGVVDAAVSGGTKKYEEAFFTDNYLKANPTHKARNLMVPLFIEMGSKAYLAK